MRASVRTVLALVAVGAVGLAAASPGAAATKPKPTPLQIATGYMKAPTTINQKIPLKTKPPRGKKVIFMQSGLPQQKVLAQYMGEALTLAGWTWSEIAWTSSTAASVTQNLANALLQDPDYVIAPAADPRIIPDSLKQQYLAAGVPIISGQFCSPGYKWAPPVYSGFDMCEGKVPEALALANWIAADSKGAGKVLIANVQPFEVLQFWADQLATQLKKACSACESKIVPVTYAQFLSGQAPSVVVNALRANPGYRYVMFDYGTFSRGILPALDAAGLLGKVSIGGRVMDPGNYQALKDQQQDVWTATPIGTQGYAIADIVFRMATKSPGAILDAADRIQLVTNVNVNTIPNPYNVVPANSLAQFKKLWKL